MSSLSSALNGNWEARAMSRVKSRGYASVLDYLRDHPAKPYLVLANDLGPDVAAMQLIRMAFEDAQRQECMRWASMDCLVRELHEVFPVGWGKVHKPARHPLVANEQLDEIEETETERIDFQKAKAVGIWVAMVDQIPTNAKPRLRAVWAALEELCPPVGWLPRTPDDALVVAAFDKGWPASDKHEKLPVGPHLLCPQCGAVMPQDMETTLDQVCALCSSEFPLP